MENFWFHLDLSQGSQNSWLVYSLKNMIGEKFYVGVCNISSVMNIPDARKHPAFSRFFKGSETLTIEIHKTFKSKREANVWRRIYLCGCPRPHMMKYFGSYGGKVAVKCIDTGEVFESLKSCANAHGVDVSNLSKHINGDSNYRTVGGRSYEHARYQLTDRGGYSPY